LRTVLAVELLDDIGRLATCVARLPWHESVVESDEEIQPIVVRTCGGLD
jgi:hypothetical protein